MDIEIKKWILKFKLPAGTSRGVLLEKPVWFIILKDNNNIGIGECNPLKGLSIDDIPNFSEKLIEFAGIFKKNNHINLDYLNSYPSMKFGFEMAMLDLNQKEKSIFYPSKFTKGTDSITINGLVWMGKKDFMVKQIEDKFAEGFTCIKLKIGAIDFNDELNILKSIRSRFTEEQIEIRVDANGAFDTHDALEKLNRLSEYNIHSIEQPIKQGNWKQMAELCENPPIPIALDEELIKVRDYSERRKMLEVINPEYIILKPSLLGGFAETNQWIELAEGMNIKWWITSALESNIGLNAIAQYTYIKNNPLPQGLGTGKLYTNNISSPLFIENGELKYGDSSKWVLNEILNRNNY